MDEIEIRRLDENDEGEFRIFLDALLTEKKEGSKYSSAAIGPVTDFNLYLKKLYQNEKNPSNPDYSPATAYYYFKNGSICAKITCRWDLSKGNLSTEGGHIGYVTAPTFRGQGIMSELLQFALGKFEERQINDVFITALEDNIASRATIEKAGGRLDSYYEKSDGEILARYWIRTVGEDKDG
ncbi:GNAT family N-acetyltransferase [Streptococcaceae bacterium ESL0729]|nr:GNAT family N-acetyltransferase [Streptococcaceae bacterium ESL0729]